MSESLKSASLDDKYTSQSGNVLLSGTQALVRLLLMQQALDRREALKTAGYVSGYRGSPLGGFDQQLWRAKTFLDQAGIVFQPGVNEDLAATAIWGTQQVTSLPGARVQGVFSLWYGKGPGVDRSCDAIKHGNRMGSAPCGGVLLAAGDDHAGKSSTVAHQSDQALSACGVPILYPASVQEILDFGLLGWALSRFAGVWVGLKCVNETVETTSTACIDINRSRFVQPQDVVFPREGLHARMAFDPMADDVRLHRYKLPAAQAFARVNGIDRLWGASRAARLGIVAAGKSFTDTISALAELGIDAARAERLGIRVCKPGLIWPLDKDQARFFATDLAEMLVIEEKAPFIEPQLAHLLFNLPAGRRPTLIGKRDEKGVPLLPSDLVLEGGILAEIIADRLLALGIREADIAERAGLIAERRLEQVRREPSPVQRVPYFCPGCPHNTSTRVPEGSLALSGIGCHTMAISMERQTLPPTHMGGEGMTWAGMAPFTETPHVFQNLGDGTYFHSGVLAIRAAVASGVSLTYKLLFNDAVAMTGGQPVEGNLSLTELTHQLAAERVRRIAVVSDNPDRWQSEASRFASGVTIHHRRELDRLQREFRLITGVTAIVYEQACAAEKRRRRKRGALGEPDDRVFINAAVCEGCGDCSVKSNCVAVQPLETPLGRKRYIDQSACNRDYTCTDGFCPSFVRVLGARVREADRDQLGMELLDGLPEPSRVRSPEPSFAALIAGVGGTGVVTIGAVLAMAAHLEGKRASVFDMTGLAQKGGSVLSHLRIGPEAGDSLPVALAAAAADTLLGCDLVVASANESLHRVRAGQTRVYVNTHLLPVAQFQRDRDMDFRTGQMLARLRELCPEDHRTELDVTRIAEHIFANSIAANMILTGYAYQDGALPLSSQAIEQAIELNETAVGMNRDAFRFGRVMRAFPERVTGLLPAATYEPHETDLESVLRVRSRLLEQYQNRTYANRFGALIGRVRNAELAVCGGEQFSLAVARNYAKLLAYKDEYEVARLYAAPEFQEALRREFQGRLRLRILLAPPLFAGRDPDTGEPKKIAVPGAILPLFRILAAARFLRGTMFDPFRHTADRRLDRALILEYESILEKLLAGLSKETHALAIEIASVPDTIRGFGHVRSRSVVQARSRWSELMPRYRGAASAQPAVASRGEV